MRWPAGCITRPARFAYAFSPSSLLDPGGSMRTRLAALTLSSLFFAALVIAGCDPESTTPDPDPPVTDPAKLDPPAAGKGFQFETEDIEVAAGVEEQDCYFYKVSELAQQG